MEKSLYDHILSLSSLSGCATFTEHICSITGSGKTVYVNNQTKAVLNQREPLAVSITDNPLLSVATIDKPELKVSVNTRPEAKAIINSRKPIKVTIKCPN